MVLFPTLFLLNEIHMGLEQLALIKEQLAKKAQADRAAQPLPVKRVQTTSTPRVSNKDKQKQKDKKDGRPVDPVLLAIGELQRRFPQAFPKKPAAKVPLKLGIHKDVLAQAELMGIAPKLLQEALKTWVWGSRYWACLVENAMRVDLSGAQAGQVTQPEAERARRFEGKRGKASNVAPVAVAPAAIAGAEVPVAGIPVAGIPVAEVPAAEIPAAEVPVAEVSSQP
jgi:ProP effector